MFSRSEIKIFIIKLGQRWIFPDFSNKLTWAVVTAGIGVIVMPQPLKLVFFNWLVDLFNLNAGKPFTLAQLNIGPDYAIGAILIAVALIHNLGHKYLQRHQEVFADQAAQRVAENDKALLARFIQKFPSNGDSATLLRDHEFGGSFAGSRLTEIIDFSETWSGAEFCFCNEAIDEKRKTLLLASKNFLNKLAIYTAPIGNTDLLSAIPDAIRSHDRNIPAHVRVQIAELNDLAAKAYSAHQDLIATGKGTS